jgi:hypothetical protein
MTLGGVTRIPATAQWTRRRYRPSCSCGAHSGIVMAPPPSRLIPKSLLGVAIWVTIPPGHVPVLASNNHWTGLTVFVEHPEVPMDNNTAERSERGSGVARKNYRGRYAVTMLSTGR